MAGTAQKKLAEIADYAVNFRNEVHEYHRLLVNAFLSQRKKKIKTDFGKFASGPAINIIQDIASMEEVSRDEKIAALTSIYEAVALALDDAQKPQLSTVFWKDRGKENRFMSPCQFVIDNYPAYHTGELSLDMIKHHDKPLYQALQNRRKRQGWDEGFDLPTKPEACDRAIRQGGGIPTYQEIMDASPPPVRRMLQLYRLGLSRGQKTKKI